MKLLIILSLHLNPHRAPFSCFMWTNSAPNTNHSNVDCFSENFCTNVLLTYIKKPLFDEQDTFSPAWSLSTNMQMSTSFLEVLVYSCVLPPWHLKNSFQSHSLNMLWFSGYRWLYTSWVLYFLPTWTMIFTAASRCPSLVDCYSHSLISS